MKINDLIAIEKELLEFEVKHRFEIDFTELIELERYLSEIGKITTMYFDIQYEYSETLKNDEDKLEKVKTYQEKLKDCELSVAIDLTSVINFIDKTFPKYEKN